MPADGDPVRNVKLLIDDRSPPPCARLNTVRWFSNGAAARCAYCLEIIGVYEPVSVMLGDGTELKGSSLTLGDQLQSPGSVALHAGCHDVFEQSRKQGRTVGSRRDASVVEA